MLRFEDGWRDNQMKPDTDHVGAVDACIVHFACAPQPEESEKRYTNIVWSFKCRDTEDSKIRAHYWAAV